MIKFLKGMVVVMGFLSMSAIAEPLRVVGEGKAVTALRWQVVNDTVMGGQSSSRLVMSQDTLTFSGRLNTNGGGFASLRSDRLNLDLTAATIVRLKVKGDGRPYSIRLYAAGERVSYQQGFTTVAGQWQTVELTISEFQAAWRGRRFHRPPLAAADIVGMGLILADGVDGAFQITVDFIEFDDVAAPGQPGLTAT